MTVALLHPNEAALPAADLGAVMDLHDSEVILEDISAERVKGGRIIGFEALTHSGLTYPVAVGFPDWQRTDVAVASGTPLGTNIGGFNHLMLKWKVAHGFTSVLVGPPNYNPDVETTCLKDAEVLQKVVDHVVEWGDVSDQETFMQGYSRPTINGWPAHRLSALRGRRVSYFDCIDPCLLVGRSLKAVTSPGALLQYGKEVIETGRAVLTYSPHEMVEIATTLPTSRTQLLGAIAAGKVIYTGEAGSLIGMIPDDAEGYIELFAGNRFNDTALHVQRLEHAPGVVIQLRDGLHMTGARKDIQQAALQRLVTVADRRAKGQPLTSGFAA